jgi:hypothetical protein
MLYFLDRSSILMRLTCSSTRTKCITPDLLLQHAMRVVRFRAWIFASRLASDAAEHDGAHRS